MITPQNKINIKNKKHDKKLLTFLIYNIICI